MNKARLQLINYSCVFEQTGEVIEGFVKHIMTEENRCTGLRIRKCFKAVNVQLTDLEDFYQHGRDS